MRKVMYIFAQGDFPPSSGSLQVITLQCGQSPWGTRPLPTPWAGPVHFTVAGLLTAPGVGAVGAKVLISEPVGLPYSIILCPKLQQPSQAIK